MAMKKLILIFLVLSLLLFACSSRKDLADRFPAKYRGFYNLTKYVLTEGEFDEFLSLPENKQEQYVIDFWEKTNPFRDTLTNEFRDLLIKRTKEADERFTFAKTMGSDTDRGMIYIMYGPPDDIETRDHDKEYDTSIRDMSQRRETEADIAGDYRKEKNYEYWTYDNTLGLKPGTTVTFVDDYSSGQYKLLSNLLTYQDRNIPNPLRLYLTEEGRVLYQRESITEKKSILQKLDEKKQLVINLDYGAFPVNRSHYEVLAMIYIPLRNLVFIENDISQAVSIVDVEAVFTGKEDDISKSFNEQIVIPQDLLARYQSTGSYLMSIAFAIPMSDYSLDITVTDVRTKNEGSSSLEISPVHPVKAGSSELFCSDILLSAQDEERIFTKRENRLILEDKSFKPVYGNVYSRTKQLLLYQDIYAEGNNLPQSLDIMITLRSKKTGAVISSTQYSAQRRNSRYITSTLVDVSKITTGHYEITLTFNGQVLKAKDFYFLR